MIEIIKPEETEEMQVARINARELCETALAIKVNDLESFNLSAEKRVALSHAKKRVEDTFAPMIKKVMDVKRVAEEARKEAVQLLEKALKPFVFADNHLKNERIAFSNEQERIRKDLERKEREKAEEVARKEKLKLAEEAKKLLEKAKILDEEGQKEKAESLLEKAEEKEEQKEEVFVKAVDVAPVVQSKTKLDDGTVYNVSELIVSLPESEKDLNAFFKAISDGDLPQGLVKILQIEIKKYAKLQNWKNCKKFGITIEERISERVRK